MTRDTYLEQFQQLTLSAAHGILVALHGDPNHPEAARLALEVQGDLLQAEAPIPPEFKHWASRLDETFVDELVRAATAEAVSWPLPDYRLATVDDENGLALVLARRDAVESFKAAVMLLMLRRGSAPCFLPGFGDLCKALRQVDAKLEATVPRHLARILLGLRSCLERPRPLRRAAVGRHPRQATRQDDEVSHVPTAEEEPELGPGLELKVSNEKL